MARCRLLKCKEPLHSLWPGLGCGVPLLLLIRLVENNKSACVSYHTGQEDIWQGYVVISEQNQVMCLQIVEGRQCPLFPEEVLGFKLHLTLDRLTRTCRFESPYKPGGHLAGVGGSIQTKSSYDFADCGGSAMPAFPGGSPGCESTFRVPCRVPCQVPCRVPVGHPVGYRGRHRPGYLVGYLAGNLSGALAGSL